MVPIYCPVYHGSNSDPNTQKSLPSRRLYSGGLNQHRSAISPFLWCFTFVSPRTHDTCTLLALEFLASLKIRTKREMVRPVAGLIYKLRFHFLVAEAVCKRHLTTSGSGVLDFLANKAYYKPLESKSCAYSLNTLKIPGTFLGNSRVLKIVLIIINSLYLLQYNVLITWMTLIIFPVLGTVSNILHPWSHLILTMIHSVLLLFSNPHHADEPPPLGTWVPGGSTQVSRAWRGKTLGISLCCSWSFPYFPCLNRHWDWRECYLQPNPLHQKAPSTPLHFPQKDAWGRDPSAEFLSKASCENTYGTSGMVTEGQKFWADGNSIWCMGSIWTSLLVSFQKLLPSHEH